jgi:hypothetical protein
MSLINTNTKPSSELLSGSGQQLQPTASRKQPDRRLAPLVAANLHATDRICLGTGGRCINMRTRPLSTQQQVGEGHRG